MEDRLADLERLRMAERLEAQEETIARLSRLQEETRYELRVMNGKIAQLVELLLEKKEEEEAEESDVDSLQSTPEQFTNSCRLDTLSKATMLLSARTPEAKGVAAHYITQQEKKDELTKSIKYLKSECEHLKRQKGTKRNNGAYSRTHAQLLAKRLELIEISSNRTPSGSRSRGSILMVPNANH